MTDVTAGDIELVARLDGLVRPGAPAAAAVVTPAGSTLAARAAGLTSDFEIGSVSKGVTGLLYVDGLARGEITPDTTLGDLLPLGDCPAAAATLAAVSAHQSGLPRLPRASRVLRKSVDVWRHGSNPYGESLDELLAQTRATPLGSARPRYSNLGFELLGHAIAAAASTTYAELLRERIVQPLGLPDTYVPATPDQVRSDAVDGSAKNGRPRQPWTGEALGPAGGIRSSITDMARLTAALLDGSAPGIDALTPTSRFGPRVQIGAAWITIEMKKGWTVTWHNGGTGGFRSWIGLDREAGTGVVVLSATTASVDRAGFALLENART
ncbi:serine hydrolase domain-containing protein [Conyzicola sp.]|uniref:serine hydrolase domain-containing protein n=1 Tax=Conyzicola sp. TaxID=1969404 RepID=UPI0039899846